MDALVASGIEPIDESWGGLPAGSLVQVHGPSGAGKTTIGLSLARVTRPAALILPERPHVSRLRAILGDRRDGLLVARPTDMGDQDEAVDRACGLLEQGKVQAVVLDSLTYLYRFEQMASTDALRRVLVQLHRLRAGARDGGGVALVTNQVRGKGGRHRPLGGPAVEHASDVILALQVLDGPWRRLRVEKHPSRPSGATWDVRVDDTGLAGGWQGSV